MKRTRDDESGAPEPKKAPPTRSDGVGIASLPVSALTHVWSYAVSMNTSDDVCENAEDQLLQRNIHDIQLVCRSWREAMQEYVRKKLRNVASVDVITAAKAHGEATTPLVFPLTTFDKTSPVTDVRVIMGEMYSGQDFDGRMIFSDDEQPLIAVRMQRDRVFHKSQPDIDWGATFKDHGEQITRLDLSRMLLYTHHLGDLLLAAAKWCPNVKSLLLPLPERKSYRNEEARIANMEALSAAMKAWHTSNGGLTHLRVPFLGLNNLISSVMFVNDVTLYCPDMEHLDGWRLTFIEQANLEFITCDDYWLSPPELFSRLWKACPKLKSFNTVVLPFGEDFYTELMDVEKPQLEELVISFNSLTSNLGDEIDSELFQRIIEMMPALRTLTIKCPQTDLEDWKASDAFDDDFFLALAKKCTKLELLTVKSFADLDKVTVASLLALLDLPALKEMTVHSILDLDDSFLEVLKDQIHKKKTLRAQLTVKHMRDMIWKVLTIITSMKPDELTGVSLSLSLKTHEAFGFVIAEGDNENARHHEKEDVHKLFEEIKRIHGSTVRVHLHTTLPSAEHDSKCVLFDSLELSINDPQGFFCTRAKFVECGMEDIEQELCEDDIQKDGIYERDPEGALEAKEYLTYQRDKRPRKIYYPGIMSDDEDEDDEFGGGFGDDDEIVFAGSGDEGEEFDEEDEEEDEEEEDEEEDAEDIFGNGEEDGEEEGDE